MRNNGNHRNDHIVLVVADVERTCRFYETALGMRAVELTEKSAST